MSHQGGASSSNASASRTPRLAFPTTRSRPTSIVDTTAPSVEASTESILSTSPASSIISVGGSPHKHTQTAADRLASAQAKDAAAAAKSHRTRTTSSTSRSSTEGSRPKLPSLLQATTTRSAATSTTSTSLDLPLSDKLREASTAKSTAIGAEGQASNKSASDAIGSVDGGAQLVSRRGSRDVTRAADVKVAGSSQAKKASPVSHPVPNAPPLVALLSDSKVSKLIKQGAEAKVYISRINGDNILTWPQPRSLPAASVKVEAPLPVLLKWRFPKTYRHPTLSNSITASRTIMEARALLRCAKAGVAVPAVRCVDEKEGILGLELIPGKSVREWLGGGAEGEDEELVDAEDADAAAGADDEEILSEDDQLKLMRLIGQQLAVMHEADIIHGDLTTSNMMLRPAAPVEANGNAGKVDLDRDEVVLIDFGLSSVSAFAEDKAVDLYVLERAFASTHPASEGLYQTILDSYAEEVTARSSGKNRGKGGKLGKWEETRRKLEEVRLRGRKRSMVGSALWQDNWRRRLAVNWEVAVHVECHGLVWAAGALPGLAGQLLRLRPTQVLRLLPSKRERRSTEGVQWHRLADRMDTELDHIGNASLLDSHTPHESCVRTDPNRAKPLISLPLWSFRASVVRLPLAGTLERGVEKALTAALCTLDRFVPANAAPSSQYAVRAKRKSD